VTRRRHPESQDQRALVQHIEARGAPGLVWFHVPQGNKLGGKISAKGIAIQGAINRGLGVRRGVSDLIFLHNAKFHALELKAEGRTPTAEQLKFIDDVNAAGGFACWCAGLEAALRVLERWQILRGRAHGQPQITAHNRDSKLSLAAQEGAKIEQGRPQS
jgi:hypothetical protein